MAVLLDSRPLLFLPDIDDGFLRDLDFVNPQYHTSGLNLPGNPQYPLPAVNQLVWPLVGLSHYAFGHVIVANHEANTNAVGGTLFLTDSDADSPRQIPVVIVSQRPWIDTREVLDPYPDPTDEDPYCDAWVYTLSDSRYLRRRVISNGDSALPVTSWGALIRHLGVTAGFTMPAASAIDAKLSGYAAPDAAYWNITRLEGESYSVAADSAAIAVGLRIVVDTTGAVSVQRATDVPHSWITTNREEFTSGGVVSGYYAAPGSVNGVSVSPTPRLSTSVESALVAIAPADRGKLVDRLIEWWDEPTPSGELRGLVAPPVHGGIQYVQYLFADASTRIVSLPPRWPLPVLRGWRSADSGGGGELATRNLDDTEIGTTADMRFDQATGVQITQGGGFDTVSMRDASPTQYGVVTVLPQSFGGRKTFRNAPSQPPSSGITCLENASPIITSLGASAIEQTTIFSHLTEVQSQEQNGYLGGRYRLLFRGDSARFDGVASDIGWSAGHANPVLYVAGSSTPSGTNFLLGHPTVELEERPDTLGAPCVPVLVADAGAGDANSAFRYPASFGVIRYTAGASGGPNTGDVRPHIAVGLDTDFAAVDGAGQSNIQVRGGIITSLTRIWNQAPPGPPTSPPPPPTSPPPPPPILPPPPPTAPPTGGSEPAFLPPGWIVPQSSLGDFTQPPAPPWVPVDANKTQVQPASPRIADPNMRDWLDLGTVKIDRLLMPGTDGALYQLRINSGLIEVSAATS